jgi:hypothetical protein
MRPRISDLSHLAYNPNTRLFWTTTESTLPQDGEQATSTNKVCNLLRLQSFDEQMRPMKQYMYLMDSPTANRPSAIFAHGVSDITALDDGRLIVLEREFFVPNSFIGSYVNCKLFLVDPTTTSDSLTVHTTHTNQPASRDSLNRKVASTDTTAKRSSRDSLGRKNISADSTSRDSLQSNALVQQPTNSKTLGKTELCEFRTYRAIRRRHLPISRGCASGHSSTTALTP